MSKKKTFNITNSRKLLPIRQYFFGTRDLDND